MFTILHLAIIAPFLAAVLVPLLYKFIPRIHTGWFVLIVPIILFSYFLSYLPDVSGTGSVMKTFEWIPSLGVNYIAYVDGLGLLFALLITGIGALVVLYSIYYLDKHKEQLNNFYTYLLLFMGAMLGLTLSDNLIVLYTFWEITSISSFLLISYWYTKEKSRYGALKSLLITVMGGFALLVGFVLIASVTGTYSIRGILEASNQLADSPLFLPAMLLILLGAFTKSAQFPFHIWLPDAMEAPTPVSAYLHSATMVKAGIYLVARMTPLFAVSAYWFWLVTGFGLLTLIWGSLSAIRQTDLKGILAYSTVSQLGMILSMLGAGAAALHYDSIDNNAYTMAVAAAIFHLINHATYKGSLFMMVGIIDHETGTRDIRRLGGLMTLMPISFTIAVIGGFSMAGLPPFNGFLSKEMFFMSMVEITHFPQYSADSIGILLPIVAWAASIFTFVYCMMIVFRTFTGKLQKEKLPTKPHEAPFGMLLSPLILVALVVFIGFFPNTLVPTIIEPAMASIIPELAQTGSFGVDIYFWHGFSLELFMTIGVVVLGTAIFLALQKWNKMHAIFPENRLFNQAYNRSLEGLDRSSHALMSWHMTGLVRDYFIYIFSFTVVLLLFSLFGTGAFTIDVENMVPVSPYEAVLSLVLVGSSLILMFTRSRLKAVISLGVLGYTVALFFVLFRAPDLALTQLTIETVSVTLFLLCFYHFPQIFDALKETKFHAVNFVISAAVGLTVTLIGLSASGTRLFPSISDFFLENSYKEAGGNNVVNVILVDFRGFDTLLEILVLGIASLGVYSLIKLRLAGGGNK